MKRTIHLSTIYLLAAAHFLLNACMEEDSVKLPYSGYVPIELSDGWTTASPESENMTSGLIDRAYRLLYENDRFVMARSLLVFRNGRLVAEAYPHDPADRDVMQNIQSCTKSFTSICAGIALGEGLFSSVNEPLKDIMPGEFAAFPAMGDITLRDALTMRTGIDFNNSEHTLDLYETEESSVRLVLEQNKKHDAGLVFHYHDGAPQLVSAALQTRAGMTLEEYAAQKLFAPLGITGWKWEQARDGRTFGAFSLFLTPRDCGRFGQMLLDNGRWGGVQVVDSAYVAEAASAISTAEGSGTQYGFYFWVYPSFGAFAAEGHGGQFIFVDPGKDLVIIYTAWPYTSSVLWDNFFELVDLVRAACE